MYAHTGITCQILAPYTHTHTHRDYQSACALVPSIATDAELSSQEQTILTLLTRAAEDPHPDACAACAHITLALSDCRYLLVTMPLCTWDCAWDAPVTNMGQNWFDLRTFKFKAAKLSAITAYGYGYGICSAWEDIPRVVIRTPLWGMDPFYSVFPRLPWFWCNRSWKTIHFKKSQ